MEAHEIDDLVPEGIEGLEHGLALSVKALNRADEGSLNPPSGMKPGPAAGSPDAGGPGCLHKKPETPHSRIQVAAAGWHSWRN